MGNLQPHLIHGSLGLPEWSTQMASRSVQSPLQGQLVWQADRPRYSTIDRIFVRSTGDVL